MESSKQEMVDIEFKIGGTTGYRFSFIPSPHNRQIIYKVWVQLVTRKAGIPIDLDNDLITEVYDSWYALFCEVRKIISDVNVDESLLIHMLIRLLNKGIRPHLTKHQSRFRDWLAGMDIEFNRLLTQRKYPGYYELKADMMQVNEDLIKFADELQEFCLASKLKRGKLK